MVDVIYTRDNQRVLAYGTLTGIYAKVDEQSAIRVVAINIEYDVTIVERGDGTLEVIHMNGSTPVSYTSTDRGTTWQAL